MSKPINPYEILQILDFSAIEDVEAAFHSRLREFDEIKKFTKNQSELYALIHEAYDILSNANTKAMLDDDLRVRKITNQNLKSKDYLSPHDPQNTKTDKVEEVELSQDKTIGIQKTKNNSSFGIYLFIGILAIIIGGYFLNILNNSDDKKKQKSAQTLKTEQVQPEAKAPPEPIGLIANTTNIRDNILYPDPIAFRDQHMIYAPDGSIFPLEAGLLPSLPQSVDGESSIVVQNPHSTAIFGKLVVQFTESTEPMVIRYFYIPSKQSLELFKTPSGRFQIQILTLDKPTAYVSPLFTVPLYSTIRVIQKADWAYAYPPEKVF